MQALLKVGCHPLPLEINLSEIRISFTVRIEFQKLMPVIPLIGAVSVCLMTRPFIDFSLKIANFDIMNLPSGQSNNAHLVASIIESVVADLAVYPKKFVVDTIKIFNDEMGEKIGMVKERIGPEALLHVEVLSCSNLISANILTATSGNNSNN